MPLTVVTGPANAAKAGAVLARLREVRGSEPLLVVPTSADVEHYQRELAAGGVVFGADVRTFDGLVREIASRARVTARPLGRVARERVVRAAVAGTRLDALAGSAASAGFTAAAGRFFAELQRSLVTPGRLIAAVRAWGEATGAPLPAAAEAAALYAAYRDRLARLGRPDREAYAWAALDALRADPTCWGRRPVFLYGFDDLTPTERDAVETLARRSDAEVWVALPYEPGRVAFAGRAATVEELRPLAERVLHLPERSEHYAPAARPALHHLERALFEPGAPVREPNGAVRLLEAGGERAEAELVGAEVLELMRLGMAADDIAVLVRGDEGTAALFAQVLGGYGIPVVHDVRVPFARTRLGAGLLAAARAAGPDGTAADLLRWLRTPGRLPGPAAVDALEARVRRGELHGAAAARAAWAAGPDAPPFDALDALAAALAEGPVALLAALEAEADAIWTAPHRRRAAVLAADEVADARAVAALRGAAGELRALADADAALLGDTADVLETLAAVEVREPSAVAAGGPAAVTGTGVLLAEPLDIRARRFRAVFVCGLQDGELPARPSPEPFLPDEDRRELARHAGLVLPQHEDVLDRERSLFYAVVSRPEDVVFLSWRSSDEEGNPQAASPFLDDVRALFTDALWEQRGTRLLADVTWTPRDAPTPHELRRAYASAEEVADPPPLAAPTAPAALERLAARRTESIRGLEAFASCGVKWFVDQALRPGRVDADPEPMRRGALAHRVLERTLQGLAARRGGSARVVPETLDDALAALHEALDEVLRTVAGSGGARRRALLRGLESDVERALRQEAEHGAGFEPTHLEWSFGGERDELGPLPLGGLGATGRVDRIDVGPGGRAIVRDYKGRTALGAKAWEGKHQLQVPLYLLAARELLGLEPVAGLYQPLAGPKLGARGLVRDGAVPGDYTRTDRADDEAFEAALEAARAAAEAAAAALRAGDIRPCPSACSSRGCRHPAICRAGEPTTEVAA